MSAHTDDWLGSIPGGADLIAWFGCVPSFHDAEILDLHLDRSGPSTLNILFWRRLVPMEGHPANVLTPGDHVTITFTLEDIVDLRLEGFSPQNVINGLVLRRVQDPTPSFGMVWKWPPEPEPFFEIVLEPIYGLSGSINAKRVSVSFAPGEPEGRGSSKQ